MCRRLTSCQRGFSLVEILAAVAVIAILASMAVPMTSSSMAAYRFQGDGQALSHVLGLARLRGAAKFTRARVYADLAANTYAVQVFDKETDAWITVEGTRHLSPGVTFGYGSLSTPPPNTQASIGLSPACRDADGNAIAGTACIVFNSRGFPIDPSTGTPAGGNALYITNGIGVHAVTVTSTPLIRFWWSPAHTAAWIEQQ